jgi:hypothetical protein
LPLTRAARKSLRDEKRAIVTAAKDVPCADCGQRYPAVVMDFDHQRDKRYKVSRLAQTNHSVKALRAEMDKCEVVCANCHRIRTHGSG